MPGPGEEPSIRTITALLSETVAKKRAQEKGVEIDATAPLPGNLLRAHEKLKAAMGSYYFGPEDWEKFLGVKGVELPDVPSGLTLDLLKRPDEFEPTATIAQTHALVVIPRRMSLFSLGEKVTAVTPARKVKASWIESLAEKVNAWLTGDTSAESFNNFDTWKGEAFARRESSEDTLVLIRRDFLPGSQNMTDAEQEAYLATDPRCSPYETASMLDLLAMLFLNFLKNKERLFELTYGRCEERFAFGRRAICGRFLADGVIVYGAGSYQSSGIGRAVCRKL